MNASPSRSVPPCALESANEPCATGRRFDDNDSVMPERIYLDAPSLVYRAFFALPKTITDARGRSVNAVRGFMDMVAALIVDRRPVGVVAVFDADWKPGFRVDAYAGYKAARLEDPPELPPQFDVLADVLDAAGIRRVEAPGLEADDALATLMKQKDRGERASIVTGDRDLVAVVRDPDVRLLYVTKGVRVLDELDEAAVLEKFGVPPALYGEFAMLRGDASDGLPGVSGIGAMRAAALLNKYGSVDKILANLDDLPPKQRAAFDGARAYLEAVRPVVALVGDADIVGTDERAPNESDVTRLAEEHNLGGSARRLLQALRDQRQR